MSPESKNDAIAESKEERTPFLQQYIVAPARFILFILSLTFLARKNDFQLFRARKRNSRDRAKERSRKRRSQSKDRKSLKDHGPGTALSDTENSASDGSVGEDCPLAGPPRVLRGFQRQLGVWELKKALLSENVLLPIVFRVLLAGTLIFCLFFVRQYLRPSN